MSIGYYETQNDDTLLGEYQSLSDKVRLYILAMGCIQAILAKRLEARLVEKLEVEVRA